MGLALLRKKALGLTGFAPPGPGFEKLVHWIHVGNTVTVVVPKTEATLP